MTQRQMPTAGFYYANCQGHEEMILATGTKKGNKYIRRSPHQNTGWISLNWTCVGTPKRFEGPDWTYYHQLPDELGFPDPTV